MIKDIICEGLDRTGKGTQISNLWTYFNRDNSDGCNIIRGDKMQSTVVEDTSHHKFLYQNSITQSFRNMKMFRDNNIQGVRLYDRLHLSEVVYGSEYRGYHTDHIFDIEQDFISGLKDVYLLLFIDEVDNLVKRDDGLGFTSDPEQIKNEKDIFLYAYDESCIENKVVINIANKNIEQVFYEILEFLGE